MGSAEYDRADCPVMYGTCMSNTHSQDGTATATTTSEEEEAVTTPTLSPQDNLNKLAPLEKQFKKPPPMKNRRTPSKQHMTSDLELSQVCYCRYEVKFRQLTL